MTAIPRGVTAGIGKDHEHNQNGRLRFRVSRLSEHHAGKRRTAVHPQRNPRTTVIKAHNEGKASISPIPTRINTNEFTGATLYFERVSAQSLVEAGLVSSDQIPREAFNSIVRTEAFEVRRMKDGSVTAKFKAEPFLARSTDFKRFLGSSCKTSGQSDWRLR